MSIEHVWHLRSPDGGSLGLEFLRARIAPVDRVLVHAAPDRLDAEVLENGSRLLASGTQLTATEDTPMARLLLDGVRILREAVWPTQDDLGSVVLLPGGEAGVLREWWHAPDRSAWRWQLELSNQR